MDDQRLFDGCEHTLVAAATSWGWRRRICAWTVDPLSMIADRARSSHSRARISEIGAFWIACRWETATVSLSFVVPVVHRALCPAASVSAATRLHCWRRSLAREGRAGRTCPSKMWPLKWCTLCNDRLARIFPHLRGEWSQLYGPKRQCSNRNISHFDRLIREMNYQNSSSIRERFIVIITLTVFLLIFGRFSFETFHIWKSVNWWSQMK